jgi:hypothetical protein
VTAVLQVLAEARTQAAGTLETEHELLGFAGALELGAAGCGGRACALAEQLPE